MFVLLLTIVVTYLVIAYESAHSDQETTLADYVRGFLWLPLMLVGTAVGGYKATVDAVRHK